MAICIILVGVLYLVFRIWYFLRSAPRSGPPTGIKPRHNPYYDFAGYYDSWPVGKDWDAEVKKYDA